MRHPHWLDDAAIAEMIEDFLIELLILERVDEDEIPWEDVDHS